MKYWFLAKTIFFGIGYLAFFILEIKGFFFDNNVFNGIAFMLCAMLCALRGVIAGLDYYERTSEYEL